MSLISRNSTARNYLLMKPRLLSRMMVATIMMAILTCNSISIVYAEEDTDSDKMQEEVFYYEINPAIISNFVSDSLRFLRANIAIKVRGEEMILFLEENEPMIKHHLLMLLSTQLEEELESPDGKSAIQEQALELLIEKIAEEGHPTPLEEVLFTSFLIE